MYSPLLFLSLLCNVGAYKILICYPLPVRSLGILGEGFVKHLSSSGHEVTYMTTFPLKDKSISNVRQVDLSETLKIFANDDTLKISYIMENSPPGGDMGYLHEFALRSAAAAFENAAVKQLLEDTNEHFDAIIVDLFETEIYAGLASLYNCPMIWSYSMGPHWPVLRLLDQQTNPAYAADYMSTNIQPFTFMERVEELWRHVKWNWLKKFNFYPKENSQYTKYFQPLFQKRGRDLPPLEDLIFNASLIFGTDHLASGNLPAMPQTFKLIGGYHIEHRVNPLPKDLQYLMDSSKHGVVYFSMGSTWQSKDIPKPITKGLLKIFGEFKQTVIWKYEEDLPNLPKNVHVLKWAPQPSILNHPNCILFISHGGLLSSTETLHFGVPTIGVPIYFDQFININKAMDRGYALKVDLNMDLVKNLKIAMEEMLSNPKYKAKAKELASIYHDRPVPPGNELVHWVEHVVRTRGAPHLRSPALMVPWYQKMYLDLISLIITLAILILIIAKMLFGSKKNMQKSKDKRQ